jgi:hypothetical protein
MEANGSLRKVFLIGSCFLIPMILPPMILPILLPNLKTVTAPPDRRLRIASDPSIPNLG